jgi:hypothetical protein
LACATHWMSRDEDHPGEGLRLSAQRMSRDGARRRESGPGATAARVGTGPPRPESARGAARFGTRAAARPDQAAAARVGTGGAARFGTRAAAARAGTLGSSGARRRAGGSGGAITAWWHAATLHRSAFARFRRRTHRLRRRGATSQTPRMNQQHRHVGRRDTGDPRSLSGGRRTPALQLRAPRRRARSARPPTGPPAQCSLERGGALPRSAAGARWAAVARADGQDSSHSPGSDVVPGPH